MQLHQARIGIVGASMTQGKHRGQGAARSLPGSPSHLLQRAQQLAADAFGAHFPRGDLTVRQFAILSAVDANPGLTQAKLVRITGVDRSTMADLIARLQERGFVSRDRLEADARAKSVTLTAEGKAAVIACTPAAQAADQAILEALAKSKREQFVSLLQQVVEELEARERKRRKKRVQENKEQAKKEKKRRKKLEAREAAETAAGKPPKAGKLPKRAAERSRNSKDAVAAPAHGAAAETHTAASPKRTP